MANALSTRSGCGKTSWPAFPLTPALSLGEREELRTILENSNTRRADTALGLRSLRTTRRVRNLDERPSWLPLPEGEGWGEGEGTVRIHPVPLPISASDQQTLNSLQSPPCPASPHPAGRLAQLLPGRVDIQCSRQNALTSKQQALSMNSNTKIWIRVVVIVGLLAWPAVETYRLWDTAQKLTEAQALERSVRVKLEAARAKNVQVAGSPAPAATPGVK